MRKRHEAVERHISSAQGHQETGDYQSALSAARAALAAMEDGQFPFEDEARALLLAARNAYYLSRFDETTIYLEMLEELISGTDIDAACEKYEAALIRANILRRNGDYRAALEVLADIDGSVDNCRTEVLTGERYLIEGACHYFLKDTHRAREILETALGLSVGGTDWKLRARVLTMMGLVLRRLGFMKKAADDLRRAAAACSKNNDEYGLAAALLNLGIVQYHVGELDAAEKSFIKASTLFERINWHLGRCRCLLALGNAARRRDDQDEALELYSDALRLSREREYMRETALAMSGLASIHIARCDFKKACSCLSKTSGIVSQIAPEGDIAAEMATKYGELEIARGNFGKAVDHLENAEKISSGQNAAMETGLVYRARGIVEAGHGNMEASIVFFQRARDLMRKSGSTWELAMTSLIFAESLIAAESPRPKESVRKNSTNMEPWGLLWEARHLFTGMKASHLIARIERLLGRDARVKAAVSAEESVSDAGSALVDVRFKSGYKICDGLVAVSPVMEDVWDRIQFAASFKGPVLVTGETGTGKELVARLIHNSSERAGGPFVAVNCAAIPDHLFESEFFGHRKGSFTGAMTDRRGFFEEASGGTLFLDEVGELTTLNQAKLLRVLQEGKIRRLGENGEHEVDIKLVSATNQDLGSKLSDSTMREDFFFRINSERIHIPPLRERREDIIPLVSWRLCGNGDSGRNGRTVKVDRKVMTMFQKYHWPGNVRELIAIADRLSHFASESAVTIDMLPDRMRENPPASPIRHPGKVFDCSRRRIENALSICGGNKSAAARWLGISRGKLYKELKKTGLDRYYRRT